MLLRIKVLRNLKSGRFKGFWLILFNFISIGWKVDEDDGGKFMMTSFGLHRWMNHLTMVLEK